MNSLWIKLAGKVIHELSTSSCQSSQQIQIIIIHTLVAAAQLVNTPTTVEDGCVVPTAEGIPDFREAMAREIFRQGHTDLPGAGDGPAPALRQQVGHANLVVLRDRLLDVVQGDELVLDRQEVPQGFPGELEGDRPTGETGARIRPAGLRGHGHHGCLVQRKGLRSRHPVPTPGVSGPDDFRNLAEAERPMVNTVKSSEWASPEPLVTGNHQGIGHASRCRYWRHSSSVSVRVTRD